MANNRMCALWSMLGLYVYVCVLYLLRVVFRNLCFDCRKELRVRLFKKTSTLSLSPLPIRRHSCEWLLLSSSAENGEIRALTSNLFSNSIAPGTARNIHHRRLFNPRIGCQRHVFQQIWWKQVDIHAFKVMKCHFPRQLFTLYTS